MANKTDIKNDYIVVINRQRVKREIYASTEHTLFNQNEQNETLSQLTIYVKNSGSLNQL